MGSALDDEFDELRFDTFRPFGIFDGLDGSGQKEVGKKLQLSINSGDNWTENMMREKLD